MFFPSFVDSNQRSCVEELIDLLCKLVFGLQMNDLFIDYTLHAKFDVQSVKYRHNYKDKKTEQGRNRELEKNGVIFSCLCN
jgi:hypothetical protein